MAAPEVLLVNGEPYSTRKKGKCKSCGADILWVRTEATSRLMPLDAQPVRGGNIVICEGLARVIKPSDESILHTSHFATCRWAKGHRKS